MQEFINGAEQVSLFCRLNINTKRQLPIRASEMGMLIYIVKSDEIKTPIKIAEFFKITKPMVTAMVNSMLKKGYLTKAPSQTDKRSYTLIPTEKTIFLVEQTYAEYYKTMELLKTKMGEVDYFNLVKLLETANSILLEDKNNG